MVIAVEIAALATNLFEYWIAVKFFSGFMSKRKNKNIWLFIFGVLFSGLMYIINSFNIPAVNTAGMFVLVFFVTLFIYKDIILKKLAFSILFIALIVGTELFFGFIYMIITSMSVDTYINQDSTYIIYRIVGKIILYLIVQFLLRYFKNKNHSERPIDLICLSIFPVLATITITFITNLTSKLAIPFVLDLSLIILMFSLLASSVIIFFIYDSSMQKVVEMESELNLNRETLHMNEVLFRQQQDNMDELNCMKHDYKNHLLNIISLCEQETTISALNYCKQLIGELGLNHSIDIIDFDNFVLSNVFARLVQACKNSNIELTSDIRYAKIAFISMTDTSLLFDNIFDNAIEACRLMKSGRWINIKFSRVDQYFIVVVKNSKTNKILLNKECFLSTHRGYKKSGYGIGKIKNIIEKYGGYSNIEYTYDTFTLTIRINIPNKI